MPTNQDSLNLLNQAVRSLQHISAKLLDLSISFEETGNAKVANDLKYCANSISQNSQKTQEAHAILLNNSLHPALNLLDAASLFQGENAHVTIR